MPNSSSNTSLESLAHPEGGSRGITVYAVLAYVPLAMRFVVNPAVCLVSLTASVINVITFSKMQLSQGVTQNLLILSISDTVMVALCAAASFLYMPLILGHTVHAGVRLDVLLRLMLSSINYPLYVSLIVTTVIAVVRCCSVAMPLSFRRIFTGGRQLAVISVSSLTVAAMLTYALRSSFVYFATLETNSSNVFHVTMRGKYILTIFDIFRNVLFYSCLGIIVISMLFLITALKRSSKFQRKAANTAHSDHQASNRSREAQVIKTVILVLAIFLACYLPLIVFSLLRVVLPEFSSLGHYGLWYSLLDAFVGLCVGLNVGLNFFAYYNCSRSFREIVDKMFRLMKTEHSTLKMRSSSQ